MDCDRLLQSLDDRNICPCDPQITVRAIHARGSGCPRLDPSAGASAFRGNDKQRACASWLGCVGEWPPEVNVRLSAVCMCHPANRAPPTQGGDSTGDQ